MGNCNTSNKKSNSYSNEVPEIKYNPTNMSAHELWSQNFSFPLPTQINKTLQYKLDIQFNGSQKLSIKTVPRTGESNEANTTVTDNTTYQNQGLPVVSYKNIKVQLGCDNCQILPNNTLKISVYIPEQEPGYWQTKAGQRSLGVKEWLTLVFNNSGTEILSSGSVFQRQYEGTLGLSGNIMEDSVENIIPTISLSNEDLSNNLLKRVLAAQTCPVCFDDFNNESLKKVLTRPCGHVFCVECIVNVLQAEPPAYEGRCPMCRGTVKMSELTYVTDGGIGIGSGGGGGGSSGSNENPGPGDSGEGGSGSGRVFDFVD